MNKLKIITLLVLLCQSALTTMAAGYNENIPQTSNDTTIIELQNKSKVVFITESTEELKRIEVISIDSLLKQINNYIKSEVNTDKFASDTTIVIKTNNNEIIKPEYSETGQCCKTRSDSCKSKDQIFLMGGIGMGLVRNTFAPNFEGTIGLKLGDNIFKGVISSYYMFDKKANGDYKTNNNIFLGIEYGITNKNKSKEAFSYFSHVGASYLIHSEGDYFKGNTFKFYFGLSKNGMISINPEIIVEDNFRNAFPGISIRFGF